MTAVAGPVLVAAALLLPAGAAKILRPAPTMDALRRAELPSGAAVAVAVGIVELLVAGSVLLIGGAFPLVALAATYLGFTAFLVRLRSRAGAEASCSCLGTRPAPVTTVHVAINTTIVCLAGVSVFSPPDPAWTVLAATPWSGAPALALVVLGVVLTRALYAELPPVREAARVLAAEAKGDR